MEAWVQPVLAFIAAHSAWAIAVMFIAAFGESFVFLSLLFPGTSILIAAGTLVATGSLPAVPIIIGAIAGAVLGDSISYWLGCRFGGAIAGMWPFTRNPELLSGGIRFFERHGGKSVFVGRFFGPLRAVIPLAAGLMRMPRGRFWVANVASAVLWAPVLLFLGESIGQIGSRLFGSTVTVVIVIGGLVLFGAAGAVWAAIHAVRSHNGRS